MPLVKVFEVYGTGTLSAVDSSACDLIVVSAGGTPGGDPGGSPPNYINASFSDSVGGLSNTWTVAGPEGNTGGGSSGSAAKILFTKPTRKGAGHVFSTTASYPIHVIGYSGSAATQPAVPGASVNAPSGPSFVMPAVTPPIDGCLVVIAGATAIGGLGLPSPPWIGGNFVPPVSGTNYGLFVSYQVQATAAAVSPTATVSPSQTAGASIAVFAPAVGPAPILQSASVIQGGSRIAAVFDVAAAPLAADFTATVNGLPYPCTDVSGSGTSWQVHLGLRWIRAGDVVTLRRAGVTVAATNNSLVSEEQVRYISRKFGLFLHFGIETFNPLVNGWGNGSENVNSFNPTATPEQMATQWVNAALSAGMQYACLTAKHHAGFCLFPSSTNTNFNVTLSSWYAANGNPDLIQLFCAKARAAGLGVALYFSIWDRKFEQNHPGWTGADYQAHLVTQLGELLDGRYGPIDALWLDGWGVPTYLGNFITYAQVPYAVIRDCVKGWQPNCLIVNPGGTSLLDGDILSTEMVATGGAPPAGATAPGEGAWTLISNDWWFYEPGMGGPKTVSAVTSTLAGVNANRGALLLNCGPDRSGLIGADYMVRLAEIGNALGGESLLGYGMRPQKTVKRQVSILLTSDGTTPRASLTGIHGVWFDSATPNARLTRPQHWLRNLSTDSSGMLNFSVMTTLPSGGVGFFVEGDWTGDPAQNPQAGWAGPVTVT